MVAWQWLNHLLITYQSPTNHLLLQAYGYLQGCYILSILQIAAKASHHAQHFLLYQRPVCWQETTEKAWRQWAMRLFLSEKFCYLISYLLSWVPQTSLLFFCTVDLIYWQSEQCDLFAKVQIFFQYIIYQSLYIHSSHKRDMWSLCGVAVHLNIFPFFGLLHKQPMTSVWVAHDMLQNKGMQCRRNDEKQSLISTVQR